MALPKKDNDKDKDNHKYKYEDNDNDSYNDNYNDNDHDNDHDNDNDNDKLVTLGNWDTDYNSENWEPEFMTIIVTWQLSVTLDSIRNSCDVFGNFCHHHYKDYYYHPNFGIAGKIFFF